MNRMSYIDALKGWTIFLMILGHCIQFLNRDYNFLDNKVFSVIYSFHMPIFFFLSGIFFKNSLKQTTLKFLLKKFLQLILPCLVWVILFFLIKYFSHPNDDLISGLDFKIFYPSALPFWFLVELFKSYILMFFLFKLLKNQTIIYILALIIVFIISSASYQRFLLPFFIIGIISKDNISYLEKNLKSILVISGTLFFILLIFWKSVYTIYFTDFPPLFSIYTFKFSFVKYDIAIFRFVIGLVGCYFWFLLFKYLSSRNIFPTIMNWFTKIGRETLGIYILQQCLFLKDFIDFSSFNNWITTLIILPVLSLLIIVILYTIIKLISKNRIISLLLIGKEK